MEYLPTGKITYNPVSQTNYYRSPQLDLPKWSTPFLVHMNNMKYRQLTLIFTMVD